VRSPRSDPIVISRAEYRKSIPKAQRNFGRPPLATILATVAREFGISENTIRCNRGGIPRSMIAWLAHGESEKERPDPM
jgi:hypothetical protein